MNFEINENKLEKIIIKYLNNKDFIVKNKFDTWVIYESGDEDYVRIWIRESDMTCFVSRDLSENLQSFFSIDHHYLNKILTNYVENLLGVDISKSVFA